MSSRRRTLAGTAIGALLLGLAPAAAGPAPAATSGEVKTVAAAMPESVRFGHPLPAERSAAAKPVGRQAVVDGSALVFVDLDGDGSFDRAGIDGWMPAGPKSVHVLPLESPVVLGRAEYALEPSTDGTSVHWSRTLLAGTSEQLAALEALNGLRVANG